MEGSYIYEPERYKMRVSFTQKEKPIINFWRENAKRFGVRKCKVIKTPTGLGYVDHIDAILLAKKHLESSGILTEHHRKMLSLYLNTE
ncbi:MAG: hypothetical protein ACUVTD_00625 [Nitrososphaerales archaeon]